MLLLPLRHTRLFRVFYFIIKKLPAIPQVLVDGKFVSDFCEKANLFNNLFSIICTPIQNRVILPPFYIEQIPE